MNRMLHPILNFFQIDTIGFPPGTSVARNTIDKQKCGLCGTSRLKYAYLDTMAIIANGSQWHDILTGMDTFVLHERVVDVMDKAKLTGYIAHPLTIVHVESRKLAKQPYPQYYRIEITGQVDVDWNELDDVGGSICPQCFARKTSPENKYCWQVKRYLPLLQTWDGSDFMEVRNLGNYGRWCTRKFIDLFYEHKWSNFTFRDIAPGYLPNSKYKKRSDLPSDDWFENISACVMERNPDLFGLSEEVPNLPPPIEPRKKQSESEAYEEQVQKLQNPRFDLIEAHFQVTMPQPLKELYENQEKLLQRRLVVDIPIPQEILKSAGDQEEFVEINIETYSPLDGKTMETWGPGMENYLEFASDGSGGIYCVDPRENDPEVHLFLWTEPSSFPWK